MSSVTRRNKNQRSLHDRIWAEARRRGVADHIRQAIDGCDLPIKAVGNWASKKPAKRVTFVWWNGIELDFPAEVVSRLLPGMLSDWAEAIQVAKEAQRAAPPTVC